MKKFVQKVVVSRPSVDLVRGGKNTIRRVKIIKNLSKEVVQNPGHVSRKLIAGVAKDPVNSVVVASNAIPIPGSTAPLMATAPVIKSRLTKDTIKSWRQNSKNILDNSGKSTLSKIGRKIEHYGNKVYLKAGELGTHLSQIL